MANDDSLWVFDSEELTPKEMLLGIPFVITELAYRYVEQRDETDPKAPVVSSDYVSVTGRVASAKVMAEARERSIKAKSFFPEIEPESLIVFNDGSTGIRRQITGLLHLKGLINIGNRNGEVGNAVFDRKFFNWESHEEGPDGELSPPLFNIAARGGIQVLKGLRMSGYEYGGRPVITYYLS
jgi:hypothetical protein